MKTILVFFISLLTLLLAKGQDIIHLKTGKSINGKVMEVGSKEIKYKKALNDDGPVYILDKNEVVSIEYQNGLTDHFSTGNYGNYAPEEKKNQLPEPPVNSNRGNTFFTLSFGEGFIYQGINGMADYFAGENFSIGGAVSFQKERNSYQSGYGNNAYGSSSRTNIALRPLFHFGNLPNADFYVGPRVGISIFSGIYSTTSTNNYTTYLPSMQVVFGSSVFLVRNFALNGEVGLGSPYYFAGGVVFKF